MKEQSNRFPLFNTRNDENEFYKNSYHLNFAAVFLLKVLDLFAWLKRSNVFHCF